VAILPLPPLLICASAAAAARPPAMKPSDLRASDCHTLTFLSLFQKESWRAGPTLTSVPGSPPLFGDPAIDGRRPPSLMPSDLWSHVPLARAVFCGPLGFRV